ncbi:uncharacterized protein SAPINGB_P003985 [Magnusiomyces paraingens]|uniref:Uncharacterized protein n=1 Tax=Magnusiomyces paraingens TaxID=2606893 RepID=A0A5E8BXM0_9ASCO|nr:uncharacterized protein SAPINGB_P003985 [Saprochaete ingens]VVT54257.1 unnamed protein product [Saprochaete ingens]
MKSENWHRKSSGDTNFVHPHYTSTASTAAAAAAASATAQGSKKKSHKFSVVVAKAMHKVRRIFFYKRGVGTGDPAATGALVVAGKRGYTPSVTMRRGSRIRSTSNGSLLPIDEGVNGGSSSRRGSYRSGARLRGSLRKTREGSGSYRSGSSAMIFPYNSLSRSVRVPEKYSSTKIYTRLSQLSGQKQAMETVRYHAELNKSVEEFETPAVEIKPTSDTQLRFHRASSYIACLTTPHKYLDTGGNSSELNKKSELGNKAIIEEEQEEQKEEKSVGSTADPKLEEDEEEEEELDENHARVPGWTHSIRIEEPYPESAAEFTSSPKKPKNSNSLTENFKPDTLEQCDPISSPSSIAPPIMVTPPQEEDICKVLPLDQAFESIIRRGASAEVSAMDHEVVINTYRNKYLADLGYSPTNIFENEPDRKSLSETTESNAEQSEIVSGWHGQSVKDKEEGCSFVIDHDGVHYQKQGPETNGFVIPKSDIHPVSANSLDSGTASGSLSSKDSPGNPIMYYFSENSPQPPVPPPSQGDAKSGETLKRRRYNVGDHEHHLHQHHTHLGPNHHTVRRRFSASSYSSTSSTQKFQSTGRRHADRPPLKSCIKKKTAVTAGTQIHNEETSLTSISVNQASPKIVTPRRGPRAESYEGDGWEEEDLVNASVSFENNRKGSSGPHRKPSLTSLTSNCAGSNTSFGTNVTSSGGSGGSRSKRVRFLIDVESVASKSPVLTHLMRRSNVNTSLFVSPVADNRQQAPTTRNSLREESSKDLHSCSFTTVSEAVTASPLYAFNPPRRTNSPPPPLSSFSRHSEGHSREGSLSPTGASLPVLYSTPQSSFLTPPNVLPLGSTGPSPGLCATPAAGFLGPAGNATKLSRLALGTGVHGGFMGPVSAVFGSNAGLSSSQQPRQPLQGRRGNMGAAEIGINVGYSGVWGR